MERRFLRTVDALEDVFGLISGFAARYRLDASVAFQLNVAIEELFVNMVKHNLGGGEEILISMMKDGDKIIVTLTDSGVEAFDITKADVYDTRQMLADRPIGHLGIHLVRKMVDEIEYNYEDRQSRITLIKNLGKTNVPNRPAR
jgi:anti-sigma regulatory factor (Ser/Thr protein kinase)